MHNPSYSVHMCFDCGGASLQCGVQNPSSRVQYIPFGCGDRHLECGVQVLLIPLRYLGDCLGNESSLVHQVVKLRCSGHGYAQVQYSMLGPAFYEQAS